MSSNNNINNSIPSSSAARQQSPQWNHQRQASLGKPPAQRQSDYTQIPTVPVKITVFSLPSTVNAALNEQQIKDLNAAIQQIQRNNGTFLLWLPNSLKNDTDNQALIWQTLANTINDNQAIRSLYLENNQIGDAGATAIANVLKDNQSIKTLGLTNNQIGDEVVERLQEFVDTRTPKLTLYVDDQEP